MIPDSEINELIKGLSDTFHADNVRHMLVGINRENKNMYLRLFASDLEIVNIILTILNSNPRVWEILYERMSQIETLKMHLIMREGGNT